MMDLQRRLIGAARIFERSIQKHGVRYTKYYDDVDSKSFEKVRDIYQGRCIGHYQKMVGNRLRNLRKKTKGIGGNNKKQIW